MGNTGGSWTSGSGAFSFASFTSGSSAPPPPPQAQDQHFFLDSAKRGDFATVRRLVEANELYVNVQPRGRWAALHQFAEKGDVRAVQFLLDHCADPSARTKDGKSPADVAKSPEVQAILLDAGAPLAHGRKGGKMSDLRSSMLPLDTMALVKEAAPKRTEAEVAEAVRKAGGDADLAMEALLTDPPSIIDDPEKWFHHFDLGGDGLLQEHEVVVALWHSLGPEENKADIAKLIHRKWPEFDWDNQGHLDFPRFTEDGGLRDFIVETWGDQLAGVFYDLPDTIERGPSKESLDSKGSRKDGKASLDEALADLESDGILAVFFTARLLNDFTKDLRERYRRFRELGLHFEVLFVSMDADRASFEAYGSMDWKVIPFGSNSARRWLADKLEVRAVPQLVLLQKDGTVVNRDATKALKEDVDGSGFPWPAPAAPSIDAAEAAAREHAKGKEEGDRKKMRSVVQSIIGRRSDSSDKLVDDVSLARAAARAPLTEEGYRQVAAFKSNHAMKRFAQRVIATKQWVVLDNEELTRLIWEHSGVNKSQSLEKLLRDLRSAKWITEADVSEDCSPELSPVPAGADQPETGDLPGLRTQMFRHAFVSLRPPPTGSFKMRPSGIEEGEEEAEDDLEKVTLPIKRPGDPVPKEETGASVAVSLEIPAGVGETAPGEAAPGPAPGKGPAKGPGKGPAGPKGKGKAPGKPPAPVTAAGGGADAEATSAETGASTEPAPQPGPPVAGKGKGKAGPPAAPPGKGPEGKGPPGKGPPGKGPPGKGPPALPAKGKGAPPAGGKGKAGGWAKEAANPTREEITDWKDKKKNPLRWKRLLQEDGLFDDSLFAGGESDLEVDDLGLAEIFVKDDTIVAKKLPEVAEAKVVKKPVVWEATEKKGPSERRQMIAIQMKAWSGDSLPVFLHRLQNFEFNAIRRDPDFREDRFELLSDLVDDMNEKQVEWQRLAEPDAASKYEWDKGVEGFFLSLRAVPNFKERIASLKLGLMVEREVDSLSSQAQVLSHGMEEVLRSAVLKLVFRKILLIGNRLNAGEAKFGRADGFDVVALLETTDFLRMYKGNSEVNLLKHLQEKELTDENLQDLVGLATNLKEIHWKPSNPLGGQDEGSDPTDLGDLRKRSNDVSRALGILGKFIDAVLMRLGSSVAALGELATMPESPASIKSESPAASEPSGRDAVLRQMEEYCQMLEDCKRKSIEVESGLDSVEESLTRLHRFLAHKPPKKKELVAGHSLGVVAYFVRMLAAAAERDAKKRRTAVPRGRRSHAPSSP